MLLAASAHVRFWQILLQKSLRVSSRSDSLALSDSLRRRTMMGRLNHDQEQLFYSFHLEEAVPQEHSIRKIAAVLDLSWRRRHRPHRRGRVHGPATRLRYPPA